MRAAPLTTAVDPCVPMSGLRPHLARVQKPLLLWRARARCQRENPLRPRGRGTWFSFARCVTEKRSGEAKALEVRGGESFAVR